MRAKLKELAFSENLMFNGNGHIRELDNYIREVESYEPLEYEDEILSPKKLSKIQSKLKKMFSGENTELKIKNGDYTNWMVAVEVNDNTVRFYGDDDGPCNGYDPILNTNIFSMETEQDYYMYIDPCFGQDSYPPKLFIDLKKVTVS